MPKRLLLVPHEAPCSSKSTAWPNPAYDFSHDREVARLVASELPHRDNAVDRKLSLSNVSWLAASYLRLFSGDDEEQCVELARQVFRAAKASARKAGE